MHYDCNRYVSACKAGLTGRQSSTRSWRELNPESHLGSTRPFVMGPVYLREIGSVLGKRVPRIASQFYKFFFGKFPTKSSVHAEFANSFGHKLHRETEEASELQNVSAPFIIN